MFVLVSEPSHAQSHVPWPPPDMKGAAALRCDCGWRAWIKITINRIKKNKYLAIIEAEWFILRIHSTGWTAAPEKSICNYRHPTLGRSSPSIHLPPPAPHTTTLKTNVRTALGPEQEEQEIKDFSLVSTALCFCVFTFCTCTVLCLGAILHFRFFWIWFNWDKLIRKWLETWTQSFVHKKTDTLCQK